MVLRGGIGLQVEFHLWEKSIMDIMKNGKNLGMNAKPIAVLAALTFISFVSISAEAFGQPTSDQYSAMAVKVDGKQYLIRFMLYGGASIQNMTVDKDTKSLIVTLAPDHGNDTLSLQLPRNMIDAQGNNGDDIDYMVSVDGTSQNFTEFEKSDTARAIRLSFSGDARQITISGTYVVPEFGMAAALVIITSGMIATLALTRFVKQIN
jgi:hypothetical protein